MRQLDQFDLDLSEPKFSQVIAVTSKQEVNARQFPDLRLHWPGPKTSLLHEDFSPRTERSGAQGGYDDDDDDDDDEDCYLL